MTQTKIFGLLGYPVKHSFSPAMHNAAFKYLKIDAEYKLFEKKPEELNGFLNSLSGQNIYGLNVTVPYKEKVLDFVKLDQESFYLSQIKAVNTIVRKDNILKGFNTDIPGFAKHLKENINPEGKKAAILGAGGASRAITYVLANLKSKEICIFDIDKSKSESIIEMIKKIFPNFPIYLVNNIKELDIENRDLLINTTPIGMKESDPCLIKKEMLHKNLFVYDLIYNPSETKLLKLAKNIGCKTSNGLGMLLYQGARSFELWTGEKAPIEIMRQALNEEIKNYD